MSETERPLISAVPDARTVRAQVGERLRELRLLRRLLRLAEAVDDYRHKEPSDRREAAHA